MHRSKDKTTIHQWVDHRWRRPQESVRHPHAGHYGRRPRSDGR